MESLKIKRRSMMQTEAHQWALDLTESKNVKSVSLHSSKQLLLPPGYKPVDKSGPSTTDKKHITTEEKSKQISSLQLQKAWRIALQPAKAVPMNIFMSYMSGTSLQIIPIMAALMLLSGPIKATFGVKNAFKPIMGNPEIQGQTYFAMFVYVLCQGALMYIGVRKLNAMGLIPNTRSDWLAWEKHVDYNNGIKSFAV